VIVRPFEGFVDDGRQSTAPPVDAPEAATAEPPTSVVKSTARAGRAFFRIALPFRRRSNTQRSKGDQPLTLAALTDLLLAEFVAGRAEFGEMESRVQS
jgi:hypothetical protein